MENSFWRGAKAWNFKPGFKEAWELYVRSGTKEKAETAIQALGGYSLVEAGQLEGDKRRAFGEDLLQIILRHRLRAFKPFVSYQMLLIIINIGVSSPPRRSTSDLTVKTIQTLIHRYIHMRQFIPTICRLS